MKFSGLVFPAPNPPTYSGDRLVGEILYVPKDFREHPLRYAQGPSKQTIESTMSGVSQSVSSATALHDIGNR